jgi:multiple antibiotic resistance protein
MAELNRFFAIVLVAVGGLLPIVDPLAGAPFFLASTSGLTSEERRTMARSVAINSFLLLIGSILIGSYVLDFLGLSISAVQVGGGLVVCGIAWSLLNAPTTMVPMAGKAPAVAAERDDLGQRAFYPLTMPLTVGPGSISVAITLGANPEQGMRELGMTALAHIVGVVLVSLSVYVCYRYADPILKRVGRVGTSVFMRLSAFILLCIGVQICWNGVHSLLLTVVH